MKEAELTPARVWTLIVMASAALLPAACREQAPPPAPDRGADAPGGDGGDAGVTSDDPPASPPETAAPVVFEAWRLIASPEPAAVASLIERLAAMSEEARARARRATWRVTDVTGSSLEIAGESFDFPSAREWGRPFVDAVSSLPPERQVRVLESLDALLYGVMRSRDALVESWRASQRTEYGDETVDASGEAFGSSPAEWLMGTPSAYEQATWWRGWIANRLSELTEDPDLAAAHAARSQTLHRLVRSGRFHEGDAPP